MKIILILLLLLSIVSFSYAGWEVDKRLLKSINTTTGSLIRRKLGRDWEGGIAVGYFTVSDCASLPTYTVANTDKKCFVTPGTEQTVKYICLPNTGVVYFANPGDGFIIDLPITAFDDSAWTTGQVPGTPAYTRCTADCEVGYCASSCIAKCNTAGCIDTYTGSTTYFIVPQSTAAEPSDLTHCGGQNTCCDAYNTVTNYNSVDDTSPSDVLYYSFEGTGISVPNLASSPPVGTEIATLIGSITQGGSYTHGGALIGTGGNNNYMKTNWATNLNPGGWSISFRCSNILTSTIAYIFGDFGNRFRCFTNGVAGADNWILRGNNIPDVLITGGATVLPHTISFVYNQALGNIKGYLDGILVTTVPASSSPPIGQEFQVGGYSTSPCLPSGGTLDDFSVFSYSLSDAEVLNFHNQ